MKFLKSSIHLVVFIVLGGILVDGIRSEFNSYNFTLFYCYISFLKIRIKFTTINYVAIYGWDEIFNEH